MDIGQRIRHRRRMLDITQEELAEMVGVNQRQVWKYESDGAVPRGDTLRSLAQALHTSTDYLLGLSDIPEPRYDLSAQEILLLTYYREKDRKDQKKIIEIVKLM